MPPRPFGDALVLRAAVVWLFLHGAMGAGSATMGVPFPRSFVGTPITALWLTAATVTVVWAESRRQRELVFLANLGYPFRWLGSLVAVECIALDVALRLLFA